MVHVSFPLVWRLREGHVQVGEVPAILPVPTCHRTHLPRVGQQRGKTEPAPHWSEEGRKVLVLDSISYQPAWGPFLVLTGSRQSKIG